jgi:hypothetical protein
LTAAERRLFLLSRAFHRLFEFSQAAADSSLGSSLPPQSIPDTSYDASQLILPYPRESRAGARRAKLPGKFAAACERAAGGGIHHSHPGAIGELVGNYLAVPGEYGTARGSVNPEQRSLSDRTGCEYLNTPHLFVPLRALVRIMNEAEDLGLSGINVNMLFDSGHVGLSYG